MQVTIIRKCYYTLRANKRCKGRVWLLVILTPFILPVTFSQRFLLANILPVTFSQRCLLANILPVTIKLYLSIYSFLIDLVEGKTYWIQILLFDTLNISHSRSLSFSWSTFVISVTCLHRTYVMWSSFRFDWYSLAWWTWKGILEICLFPYTLFVKVAHAVFMHIFI